MSGWDALLPEVWSSLWLTLRLAAVTTLALLCIAIPLAHWLNHSASILRPVVGLLVALPIVLPPTVIGFYLLVLLAPGHPPGSWWVEVFGSPLTFSFSGLVVGSVVYSLPFAVQPIQSAFRSVDPTLIEAATALGASGRQVFWKVVLPVSRAGVLVGASLSFCHTIGEFGVVLMIGGNIPGKTKVASLALYDQVQLLNYPAAHVFSFVLMAVAIAMLGVIGLLQGRNLRVLPRLPL